MSKKRRTSVWVRGAVVCVFATCGFDMALAQDDVTGSYLCLEEFGGGLYFDEQRDEWQSTTFRPDARFIVRLTFLREEEQSFWGKVKLYSVKLTEVGSSTSLTCYPSRGEGEAVIIPENRYAWCNSALSLYSFNFETLRYTKSYQHGYTDGIDNNENTPAMMGGTCTRIE